MKALLTFLFLGGIAFGQVPIFTVLDTNIDCHQGMIEFTVRDSVTQTQGEFTLEYYNYVWLPVTGLPFQIILKPDTFFMTFSGIGAEMFTYDSMRVVYRHYPNNFTGDLIYFFNYCPHLMGTPEIIEQMPIKTEYYTLFGQPIDFPYGCYLQKEIYLTFIKWSKKGVIEGY